jgi:hypothetical protein
MNPSGRKAHERKCLAWNQANAVGCEVFVTLDSGDQRRTKTTSEAYCAASGHAVIHLDGVSGYYVLDRVVRANPTGERHG